MNQKKLKLNTHPDRTDRMKGNKTMSNPTSRAAPSSVANLVRDMPKGIRERFERAVDERRVATRLAQLRHTAGLTQGELGEKMGTNQSGISKLESSRDDSITLGVIKQYATHTGESIGLFFGKPPTPVEAIQGHVNALNLWVNVALESLGSEDAELRGELKGLLAETNLKLLNMVVDCNQRLPVDAEDGIREIKVEIVTGKNAAAAEPISCTSKEPAVV